MCLLITWLVWLLFGLLAWFGCLCSVVYFVDILYLDSCFVMNLWVVFMFCGGYIGVGGLFVVLLCISFVTLGWVVMVWVCIC